MKKIMISMAVLAMAAVMASCGGNAQSDSKSCDKDCESTKCEQKSGCDDKKCDEQCKGDKAAESAAPAASAASASADLTKKYICPARCESSDNPGTCSQCGMDLVEN